MKILCLDTASTTGAAWGEIGGEPQWLAFKAKGDSIGEKKSRFRHWLVTMVNTIKPSRLIFEAPFIPSAQSKIPMNPSTLRLLLAFVGTVEEVAFDHGIKPLEATVFEITKHFLGSVKIPRAEKKAATIARCRRLGWETVSDDAADALALFSFAERVLDPEASSRRWAAANLELPLAAPARRRAVS